MINREGLLCYLNEQMLACNKNKLMSRADLFWDASAVVRAIKEYPAEGPGWISVEERLPKHGQECLVYYGFRHGLKLMGGFYGVAKWHAGGNNGYVDGPHFDNEGMSGLHVTYWMPLPNPPKEGL